MSAALLGSRLSSPLTLPPPPASANPLLPASSAHGGPRRTHSSSTPDAPGIAQGILGSPLHVLPVYGAAGRASNRPGSGPARETAAPDSRGYAVGTGRWCRRHSFAP